MSNGPRQLVALACVAEMGHPLYCPKGEFRLLDPDGYMLTHT